VAEWSFETIQLLKRRPLKKIYGKVHDSAGAPIQKALIEIYPLETAGLSRGKPALGAKPPRTRVAACRADGGGNFCFPGLKPGKYIVAVTGGPGFCKTELIVRLKPGGKGVKDRAIDVALEVGK